jgi:hypothetical protein
VERFLLFGGFWHILMNDFIPPLEQEMLQHLRLRCRLHCKKILYTSLSLFLGHLLLFGNIGRLGTLSTSQMVFAQAGTTTNVEGKAEEKLKEKVVTRDKYGIMLSKILYIALWPLLVIAGFAMDNSMVYGSIF